MSYGSEQDIVVAEVAESPSVHDPFSDGNKRSPGCLVPCLIVTGVMALIVIGIGFSLYLSLRPPEIVEVSPEEAEAALRARNEHLRKSIETPFKAGNAAAEYDSIVRFLERLAEATSSEDTVEVHKMIDFFRYAEEARKNKELGSSAYFGLSILSIAFQERSYGPISFDEFQIFDIEEIAPDERKVFLHTSGYVDSSAPYIFWLVKSGNGRWKLYDWEFLDFGIRDSRESAIVLGDNDDRRCSDFEQYVDLLNGLNEFGGYMPLEETQRLYDECQALEFHDSLKDSTYLNIAYYLQTGGRFDEAIEYLDRVEDPDKTPGAHRVRGEVLLEKREYAKAIKSIDKYIAQLGPSGDSLDTLAECYAGINDIENELKTRRNAIQFKQGPYSTNLATIVLKSDSNSVSQTLEVIDLQDDPLPSYELLLNQIGNNELASDHLLSVVRHLESNALHEQVTRRAKAEHAILVGDVDKGLEILRQDLPDEESARYDFWSRAIDLQKSVDQFNESENKQLDFETIGFIFEEYEHEFEPSDFLQIAKEMIKLKPENGKYQYLAGSALYDENKFDAAIPYFEFALKNDDELEDYEISYATELLFECLYKVHRFEDASRLIDSDNKDSLLLIAKQGKNLEQFASLIDDASEDDAPLRAYLAMEQGEFEKAGDMLTDLVSDSDPNDYYSNTSAKTTALLECFRKLDIPPVEAFVRTRKRSVFERLANDVTSDRNWLLADELIEQGLKYANRGKHVFLDDNKRHIKLTCLNLNLAKCWDQQHYQELIDHFQRFRATHPEEDFSELKFVDLEYPFRAALRLKDLETAKKIVDFVRTQRNPSSRIQILWALVEGNDDEAKRIRNKTTYAQDFFLKDSDAPQLSDAQVREITGNSRKLDSFPGFSGFAKITCLLESRQVFSEKDLEPIARDLLGEEFEITKVDHPFNVDSWLIASPMHLISIRVGGKLASDNNFTDDLLNKAFDRHKAVVKISAGTLDWKSAKPDEFCLQFATRLKFKSPLALGWDHHWMNWDNSKIRLKECIDHTSWRSDFERDSEYYYEYEWSSGESGDDDSVGTWMVLRNRFDRSFAAAYRKFLEAETSNKKLTVFAPTNFGDVEQWIPIDVSKIELKPWAQNVITGVLLGESPVDPTLRTGNSVEFSAGQVMKWMLVIDGKESSDEMELH